MSAGLIMPAYQMLDPLPVKQFVSSLFDTSALSAYTISVDTGLPSPQRCILVMCSSNVAPVGLSGTIGGVAITWVSSVSNSVSWCGIGIARVPSGLGAQNVVVSLGTSAAYCTVATYRLYNIRSIAAAFTASSTANPGSTTINVPKNGLLFANAREGNVSSTYTWTGVAEDYDTDVTGQSRSISGGSYQAIEAETARGVMATRASNGNNYVMGAASFR